MDVLSIINTLLFVLLGYMIKQVLTDNADDFWIPLLITVIACLISSIGIFGKA